jgi:hypothetical protein
LCLAYLTRECLGACSRRSPNGLMLMAMACVMVLMGPSRAYSQPRPKQSEAQRLEGLGPSPRMPTKKRVEYQRRFVGKWVNPNSEADLILAENGECLEIKPDGSIVAKGVWRVTGDGVAVAALSNDRNASMKLANDSVMGLQKLRTDGSLDGNGEIRLRDGYDWQPATAAPRAEHKITAKQIAGKWTHPNVANVWDVSPDGGWLEQKKKGGEVAKGSTYIIPEEEGFIVALENGHRLRMWTIEEDLLGFIAVTPQGSMVTDGILISRRR